MSIVGGMDIHRKQITYDYVDTASGEIKRGQIVPADRWHLATWLERLPEGGAEFAVEGCTGWRYVAEELAVAGAGVHLADPAETAGARGPKKRAKTDRADARLLRDLLLDGRVSECWTPPEPVLEARALLELYHSLRVAHTGWVQRIHAVCFHQGTTTLGSGMQSAEGQKRLAELSRTQLSPAGQLQVSTALAMLTSLDEQLDELRRRLHRTARHLHGARVLSERLYGVGPITALALCAWLGGAERFSSSRKAVRFCGLDVTVHSSAGKRAPGRLSRQGPEVLRWAVYEAGKTHARASATDHAYYAQVKDRIDGKRAALSEARKIIRQATHILTDLGDEALRIH
jgi:transposase